MSHTPQGEFVPFESITPENWTYYKLKDGTIAGIKNVLVKVYRMVGPDGAPLTAPDGSPAYAYQTTNITQILSPAEFEQVY